MTPEQIAYTEGMTVRTFIGVGRIKDTLKEAKADAQTKAAEAEAIFGSRTLELKGTSGHPNQRPLAGHAHTLYSLLSGAAVSAPCSVHPAVSRVLSSESERRRVVVRGLA